MVTALMDGYPYLGEKRDKEETSDLDFPLRKIQQRRMIRALNWRSSFNLQLRIFFTYYFNIVNQG